MYSVAIMEKVVLDQEKNIFIFLPKETKEVVFQDGKCVDKEGHVYTLITDKSFCDKKQKVGAGFPISNEELLNLYSNGNTLNLELCRQINFELLKTFVHIGFMMPSIGKIGVISKSLKSLYEKTFDANKDHDKADYVAFFDNEREIKKDLTKKEVDMLLEINELLENLYGIEDMDTMYDAIDELSNIIYDMADECMENPTKEIEAPDKRELKQLELEDAFLEFSEENLRKRIKPHMDELEKLVGLENVKEEISKLINYIIYRERTKEFLDFEDLNLNMVFTGNPGTGKTTVAGILSKMLYDLGYLQNNKTAYITAEKLIAGYVGQTAIKTRKLLDENKGGVIVVDEAYVLANEANKFGPEAIAEILKDMEKKETAFIFAGYEREMKDFMNMNSGITSRLGIKMNFPDYGFEQLFEMLDNKINRMNKSDKNRLHFSNEAKAKIIDLIKNDLNYNDFGNARYINNLAETILRNKANTIDESTSIEELLTISPSDIPAKKENKIEKVKTIGFTNKKSK